MTSSANTSTISYPYPSTLNIGNFVSLKLNENNYMLWKTQINGLIENQDRRGFLDWSYPKPEEFIAKDTAATDESTTVKKYVMNQQHIQLRSSDRLLRGRIVGTLSTEVLGLDVSMEKHHQMFGKLSQITFVKDTRDRDFFSSCRKWICIIEKTSIK